MAETQTSAFASSVRAKWCMTVLFASVAPLVQMMSVRMAAEKRGELFARLGQRGVRARADLVRAGRIAARLFSVASSQASRASRITGAVALWSNKSSV